MIRLALMGCDRASARYSGVAGRLRKAAFTAVADPDPDAAREAAAGLGISVTAETLDDLLARGHDAFDAVLIDLPDTCNGVLVEKAARAGKHVLVEMPLAHSTSEADAAIAACRSAGVCLMVGQAMRFMECHQAIKDGLTPGKLGAPGALRIHDWVPPTGVGGTPPHRVARDIDLACWLFGGLPSTVYAAGIRESDTGPDSHDYVQVHLGFSGGGMALIDRSTLSGSESAYFSLTMVGSRGAAYVDGHHNAQLMYGGDHPVALEVGHGSGHVLAQLKEFVGAIEEAREPAITGADGRAAVRVAEAAVASMRSGHAVRLNGGRYELV